MPHSGILALCVLAILAAALVPPTDHNSSRVGSDSQDAFSRTGPDLGTRFQLPSDFSNAKPIPSLSGVFVENRGQVSREDIRFYTNANGLHIGFAERSLQVVLVDPESQRSSYGRTDASAAAVSRREGLTFRITFADGNRVTPEGRTELPHRSHFFFGNDPTAWRTDARSFREIIYPHLYDGIDLVYRVAGGHLKYEFFVEPGADPARISMAYEGVQALSTDIKGNLLVQTSSGVLSDSVPVAYQGDTAVSCRFNLTGPLSVGFACSGRDNSKALLIDPLLYSTFLGGSDHDWARAVAVDGAGSVYVLGQTSSSDFPTTLGSFDRTRNGVEDLFVAKLDASGSNLLFATFLGGVLDDIGYSILLDAANNAFLVGETYSGNFPTTPGAFDPTWNGGGRDAFVTKLNATGDRLLYSTYLGGAFAGEGALGIASDPAGNAYVMGWTGSFNFPTTAGAFDTTYNGGRVDAFITKLNSTGDGLLYSTFLGGSSSDTPWSSYSIAIDSSGNAFVTGETLSGDFPTTAGALDRVFNGTSDTFVAKLNSSGNGLVYSTFIGGAVHDIGFALALDPTGNVYVTGFTDSADFPATPGSFDTTRSGADDAYVAKLNPTGTALVYATFLGGGLAPGSDSELVWSIAVDSSENALVVGGTHSPDFPVTADAFDLTLNGGDDLFLTKLNASGTGLLYSTFLGGSGFDSGGSLAVDPLGDVYVAGRTYSYDFPVTPGAFDTDPDFNAAEGFVTKLGLGSGVVVTVDTVPAALKVTVNGTIFTAPHVFSCPLGSSRDLGVPSPQLVGNSSYTFANWSDGGAQSHSIMCSSSRTITANFTTEHLITLDTVPVGLQVIVDGIEFTAPHSFWCAEGSSATLDVPSPQTSGTTRHFFASWSDGGAKMHSVTCLAPRNFTANLGTEFLVTIDTNPTGLFVVVDGLTYAAPFSGFWESNTSHPAICPSPQSSGLGTRYVFSMWSDGVTSASRTIIADSAKTLVCGFSAEYFLTISANVGTVSPGNGWYPAGDTVAISATAPPGGPQDRYTFDQWTGDYAGTVPTGTILMDSPKTVVATWVHEYEVEIQSNVPGLQVGIDGVPSTVPTVRWWEEGSSHTLAAPAQVAVGADTRWNFVRWTPGTTDPALTLAPVIGPGTYSASYTRQFLVTVVTAPAGRNVLVDGSSYSGPVWSDEGSEHSLDAGSSPQSGGPGTRYAFRHWENGSPFPVRTITVTGPATLTATYDTEYRVAIETAPTGLDILVDGTRYSAPHEFWWTDGTSHSLDGGLPQTAPPETRFVWLSWSDGGTIAKAVSVTGTVTITANFQRQFTLTVQSPHGSPACDASECWYDDGASAGFSVSSPVAGSAGVRFMFIAWTGDSAATTPNAVLVMDAPRTVVATWKTQCLLTIDPGPGEASGGGWYDSGSTAEFSVLQTDTYVGGKHYRFTGWTGGVNTATAVATVTMTGPTTVTANWSEVSFAQDYWWALAIPILTVFGIIVLVLARRRKKGRSRA